MLPRCPNPQCLSPQPRKNGAYYRPSDAKAVQRWICKGCTRHFSAAPFQAAYRHKKRRIHSEVARLLCSGVSQRRIALLLRVHRITVARKLTFLAHAAEQKHEQWLETLPKVSEVQFDDLLTLEHTKWDLVHDEESGVPQAAFGGVRGIPQHRASESLMRLDPGSWPGSRIQRPSWDRV